MAWPADVSARGSWLRIDALRTCAPAGNAPLASQRLPPAGILCCCSPESQARHDRRTRPVAGRPARPVPDRAAAGQGGTATVYLAQDLKHGRQVAVKVLLPELAAVIGAERFLHEIKITANLQHQHILSLFDSGQAGHFLYYVMPYVEGESLRSKLTREKQLPVAEAVRLASEVADALEYAHSRSVIHRDIKPENILLQGGRVLVADFGIALAVSEASGSRITQTGLSVGTPQYMSPEQAMGERDLDARSDIYSLGCVTYEMLAGSPPHTGVTPQAVVARILTDEPRSLHELRDTVPPHVDQAVLTAIRRLPADRWPSAASYAAGLQGTAEIPAVTVPVRTPAVAKRPVTAWLLAALGVALAWGAYGWLRPGRSAAPTPAPTRWVNLVLPDSVPMAFQGGAEEEGSSLSVSPDGRFLTYVATTPGGTHLVVRALDQPTYRNLPGTDGAFFPFFSPDGQWIAYFAGGQLRKISVDGAHAVILADIASPMGAAWPEEDEILVAEGGGLVKVSASGRRDDTPAQCTGVNRPCWLPDPLPGGEWVLVSSYSDVAAVSLRTGERRVILDSLFEPQAHWLPNGYIAYFLRPGQLFAVPFDPNRLAVTGTPVLVVDGVRQGGIAGQLAIGRDGSLFFASGGHYIRSRFVWVTPQGDATPLPFDAESFGVFNLSPDGQYLASTVYRTNPQIWLYDLARATDRPLVSQGSAEDPVWSPDGREIAYVAGHGVGSNPPIMAIPISGTSGARRLAEDGGYPFSWSRDGRLTFVRTDQGKTQNDIWVASAATGKTSMLLASDAGDDAPFLSPDGRWLSYMSQMTGQWEVYIEPSPPTGDRWMASAGGGSFPRWAPDGRRLYYMRDRAIYAVDVSLGPDHAAAPRKLFEGAYVQTFGHAFTVAPDGKRFLMLQADDPRTSAASLILVQGWLSEVAERVAGAGSGP